MNKQKWLVFIVVFGFTGGTAVFMNRLQAGRKLGAPGLKLIASPVYDTQTNIVGHETVDLPHQVLDYASSPLPVALEERKWLPNDTTYGRRHYKNPSSDWIDISVVLMGTDRTSIHKPQVCLEGQGWGIERSDELSIPISSPHPYDLSVMRLISPEKKFRLEDGRVTELRAVFVYWFVSDQRLTALHGERMWWMAKDLVTTGVLPRWAYVAYYTFCESDQVEATYNRMKEFIAASVPEFQLVAGSKTTVSRQSASLN
ncbi:MAG: exosortase-associated EpsI family protein [Verrucomicrobia bacterium]|nr:exosortase-associated EpsI family protein [Verrucomicrobiota bacterium]